MGGISMAKFNLDEYLKNPNRKVETRKGYPVRILAVDLEDEDFPIAAAIDNRYPMSYTSRGTVNYELRHEDDRDLFFVTEKHEGWVNVFAYADGTRYIETRIFESKEDAERNGREWDGYKTTIKAEWEE